MSKIISIDGTDYHIVTNNHTRELLTTVVYDDNDGWRLPKSEDEYLGGMPQSYGFIYRGNVYALNDFERAGTHIGQLGYDGFKSTSYFDGIAIAYVLDEYTDGIDYDNGIRVAHIHW